MRGLGKGIKEFKTASNGEGDAPTAPNKDQDAK
jgi:sec-independent protein translocase protein TatA